MGTGEIYLDFAAIMFTVFCGAFVYLVLYLHKEGKREGFPLRHDGPVDTYSTGVGGLPIQKPTNWHTVRASARFPDPCLTV